MTVRCFITLGPGGFWEWRIPPNREKQQRARRANQLTATVVKTEWSKNWDLSRWLLAQTTQGEIQAVKTAFKKIWGQYYKTFCGRKLRLFIMSYILCPWQAFPTWSNVCGQGWSIPDWSNFQVLPYRVDSWPNPQTCWKGLSGTNALAYYEKS